MVIRGPHGANAGIGPCSLQCSHQGGKAIFKDIDLAWGTQYVPLPLPLPATPLSRSNMASYSALVEWLHAVLRTPSWVQPVCGGHDDINAR